MPHFSNKKSSRWTSFTARARVLLSNTGIAWDLVPGIHHTGHAELFSHEKERHAGLSRFAYESIRRQRMGLLL